MLGVPEPQHWQGVVRLDLLKGNPSRTLVPVIGLTDFHGQLDSTTFVMDGRSVSVGGAAQLATMFDEEAAQLSDGTFLFASGDNVGASPANSGLLQDKPAIDVENAWGLDATSYGNHEFDYGVARLLEHQARANFPFLGANIVDEFTLRNPSWVQGPQVFAVTDVQVGVIGIELRRTPELVSAGATAGLSSCRAVAIQAESGEAAASGREGADRGDPRGHRQGRTPWMAPRLCRGRGRS
ncbi:MAG: hypothetical protein IPF60_09400 [Betaproteobacteria bacterium]|nr:hypothetical protein [Betaproteobacteria bacterium]